ncbi:hypothetical protein CLOSCI_00833 [[Clostridium] scindens ATCC 35704]|nr:hypothetical protein CLOSCI_00833 [[Clostridium] scindens ATCC 35704]
MYVIVAHIILNVKLQKMQNLALLFPASFRIIFRGITETIPLHERNLLWN